MRPTVNEFAPFYGKYIEKVKEDHPLSALEASLQEAEDFLPTIPAEKEDFRYAEGKWTVKELLQHVIDTERIMAYRALCFARNEKTPLPGFDENAYVDAVDVSNRKLDEMAAEFLEVKRSSLSMFRSFMPEALLRQGTMSGGPASVRALAFIIAGHQKHHFNILKERYFSES